MKKVYLLLLSFVCLGALVVYADSPCDSEMNAQPKAKCGCPVQKQHTCQKPCQKPCLPACKQVCPSECFLCTNKNMDELFNCMNLSETQICTAMKIQDKYELEVLSLNERIQCEEQKVCALKKNCAKKSEIRKVNKTIKNLKKKRKEICKCYEKQFKALLSDPQKRAYNKYKK